jgi:hypothetical protein
MDWHVPVRRRLQTVMALLPTLVVSIGLALAGLVIVRRCAPVQVLIDSNDVVGNYLQTVGTVYAVLLAFVVYVVWGQFNDARLLVEREANEIIDLYRTAKGFPEAARAHLQDHLERYTDAVLDEEWASMACGDEGCIERISKVLDETWDGLKSFEPKSGCHGALYDEALSRFNDLSDLRTARLTSARQRIPFAMRLLLYFGAVITVGSMWLFYLKSFAIHAIITSAMAGAVSHVLYLVADLDDCFGGDWQVSKAAFLRARRYMRESTAK